MNKLKNFGYGRITLILFTVLVIYTLAVPTTTWAALVWVLLIFAFLFFFVCRIYNKITGKKMKTEKKKVLSEKVVEEKEIVEINEDKEDKKLKKDENIKKDENNLRLKGYLEWIKKVYNSVIDYILGMKPWLWGLIFFVLGMILAGLGGDGSYSTATGGALCFICWCTGVIVFLIKRSKNKVIANRESQKMALEIAESIRNGTYPDIKVDIPVEADEKVYGVYNASMIKERTVRSTTSYGGPTASIKIAKGIRYRVGNISHQTESSKEAYNYDYGKLYVTTKRFVYVGDKETDTIKAKDIMKLLVVGDNIYIYKQKGKPARYQLSGNIYTFVGVMQGLNHM